MQPTHSTGRRLATVAVVTGTSAGYHETRTNAPAPDRTASPTTPTAQSSGGSAPTTNGDGQTTGVTDGDGQTTRRSTGDGQTTETPGRADDAAGRVAEQKRAFYFLNNLLRHHVLNGLNVVDGYAERLAAGETDPERATTVIRDRIATMTTVVGNVRAVADIFAGDPDPTVADAAGVARRVRDRATDAHPTVTVDTPEAAEVWCAAGGDAVVWELVENVIVHNDAGARVHLAVVETGDAVWLHVADDGPGIDGDSVIPAVVDCGGVCVSLRFRPAERHQPSTPAVGRAVEHAIDRPHGSGGDDR